MFAPPRIVHFEIQGVPMQGNLTGREGDFITVETTEGQSYEIDDQWLDHEPSAKLDGQ